jgi:hypothetical protein
MRSNSPKRTHIFGRAKLNSQTLVVICILFELIIGESNVNTAGSVAVINDPELVISAAHDVGCLRISQIDQPARS